MYLFSFKKPSKHTLSRQSKALCLLSLFLVFAFSGRGQTPTDSARNVADVVGEWLSAEYGLQPSTNNRLVIFKNGQEKFDDLFKAIKAARHSIHLEYFNFRNDSISALLFDLLAEKAAEGVEVKALFDGFGNSSNNQPLKSHHLKDLRARGIDIVEFDPMRFPWVNHALHRDHRKIVVIDGEVAYTGGMNVADYYIVGKPEFGEWRDIHARVEGDAVADLQAVFIKFWNHVTADSLGGPQYYPGERDARVRFGHLKQDTTPTAGQKHITLVDRTPDATPRIIHDTFCQLIDNAEKEIVIINPYFTLCGHIKRKLKKAIKRGVEVKIMVSAKSDIPVTPRIVEYNTHRLMKRGAEVYVFEGGFHHSKIMMVDSLCAFIGSANLNSRSLSFDYECNLFIDDRHTTAQLLDIFHRDRETRCYRLTPASWKKVSRWNRFKGWLFHFLTPFVKNTQPQQRPGRQRGVKTQISYA